MRVRVLLALLLLFAFGEAASAGGLESARSSAREARGRGPAPRWDHQVKYDDADMLHFVSEDLLLVGSVRLLEMNAPELGPLIMYDLRGRRELWRLRRKRSGESYCVVATEPLLLLRSTLGEKVTHHALDPVTGAVKWQHKGNTGWPCAYDAGQEGCRGLFVLRGKSLSRINGTSGKRDWSVEVLPPRRGETGKLLLAAESLYAINSAGITSVRRSDGGIQWQAKLALNRPFEAMTSVEDIVVYNAKRIASYSRKSGAPGWKWTSPGGVIKLIARNGGVAYAVLHRAEERADSVVAIDCKDGKSLWSRDLGGYVAGPLFFHAGKLYSTVGDHVEVTVGMVNAPVKQLHYSPKRSLVGLSLSDGEKSLAVELPVHYVGMPKTYMYACQPDLIALRGGQLLVLVEDYGLVAVEAKDGSISWRQPRDPSGTSYRKALFFLQSSGAFGKEGGKPWRAGGTYSYSAPGPSPQLRITQSRSQSRIADAKRVLGDPKSSAADRQSARESIHIAVGAQMTQMKISSTFQRLQAAAGMATAMMQAAVAFQAAMQAEIQRAKVAWHQKAMVGLKIAARQHQQSLAGKYQLYPGFHGLSLIDPDTGKRSDLVFSPVLGRAYPDLPTAALSPGNTRVATVGIGLDADNYVPRRKSRRVVIPGSSVIVYNVSDLKFKAPVPYSAVQVRREEGR